MSMSLQDGPKISHYLGKLIDVNNRPKLLISVNVPEDNFFLALSVIKKLLLSYRVQGFLGHFLN